MTTERLDDVKRRFYLALLDDPVLTLLILNSLDNCSAADLPDFKAEPWRPESHDDSQVLGIRFTRSLTRKAEVLAVSFATFHYLPVLTTRKKRTEATMIVGGDNELFVEGSDELLELDTDDDLRRQAALWFLLKWQEALREAYNLGAVIDPVSGTLTMDPPLYVQ